MNCSVCEYRIIVLVNLSMRKFQMEFAKRPMQEFRNSTQRYLERGN